MLYKNVLVAGGAGFIGSHYVRRILTGQIAGFGDNVTVLDNLTYAGNVGNLAEVVTDARLTFIKGDITDRTLLDDVLPGHELVINFAAETHVDRSIGGPGLFAQTNVLGAQTLLDAARCAGVTTVVQVSTDEVYGSIEQGSWDETAALAPNSPYSASKAGADLMARAYAATYGYDVRITRCANNYGPYQHPEKIIPLFVTNLLDGRPVPLYGDGGNVRDWVHVDDHCRGIQLVATAGAAGEIYHIGGGCELTNRELTERLLSACGAGWERVEFVPDRPGHDRRYSLDDSKLRALGYRPGTDFAEGLSETIEWYRRNRSWWEPLRNQA